LANDIRVLASPSAYCVFKKYDTSATAVNMDSLKFAQGAVASKPYYWYPISSNMRLLPIEAKHAPHFMCIHLMKHCVRCANFEKRDSATSKMHALHWREGGVYSYLLDVFSPDRKDTLRLFIQTSSCAPPYGFPPQTELQLKKVDVAILCAASFQWVSNYPEGILDKLNPKQTILIHWENFFCDMYKTHLKVVPGTNLKKLIKNLRRFYNKETEEELSKHVKTPKPLQKMELDF
jgi:hypothetical protein